MAAADIVRIGGGSGFWGDSAEGPRQLVEKAELDYLVFDYLAEITMSIMAKARKKDPSQGYATDFVTEVIAPLAADLKKKGIKVVSNAGGVNPLACCQAIEAELARQGISLKVACVTGDDGMHLLAGSERANLREMYTGAPMPDSMVSASAYLGAFPVAEALKQGADIVVTGRNADSAVALGPLIHEFGWKADDLDELASGSLAGHVIECGPQSSGGYFSDWQLVASSWSQIGYPIVECLKDGSFIVTKPEGTGGLVSVGTVSEQVTYETGDPANYILPDAVLDLTSIKIESVGQDRVRVSGVRGKPPTSTYKVSGTWQDGYRSLATLLIRGGEAVAKSKAVAQHILERSRTRFEREGLADFSEVSVEILGSEEWFEGDTDVSNRREAVMKVAVRHPDKRALDIFSREIYPASTATVQGVGGVFGGRPKVQPMVRLFSFLAPKASFQQTVHIGDKITHVPDAWSTEMGARFAEIRPAVATPPAVSLSSSAKTTEVSLHSLAFTRSGDKGDISNVAVIARRPEFYPILLGALSEEAVTRQFAKLGAGKVERFDWPAIQAMNFLLHGYLGGGGIASLRYDPQGKAHGPILAQMKVRIPSEWVTNGLVQPS